MKKSKGNAYLPRSEDRIRVFNLIDRSFELSVRKGPHPLDMNCQCIACMTKRKKRLYPMQTEWKFRL